MIIWNFNLSFVIYEIILPKKEFFTNKTGKTLKSRTKYLLTCWALKKKKKKKPVTALFVPVNQIKTSLYFCNI